MTSLDRTKLKPDLEPPSIEELAAALKEGTWLDIRVVDAGTLQRVKIECLHIYQSRDLVTVVQNFRVTPETVQVSQCTLDVDCEDIMYMEPTEVESADDVNPLEESREPLQDGFEAMKDAAMMAACEVTGGNLMALTKAMTAGHGRFTQDIINRRHLVLWALFEMSEENPSVLCYECGWRSPMPFQSARYKFSGPHSEEKFTKTIIAIVKRAREIGGVEWRRSDDNRWRDVCIVP